MTINSWNRAAFDERSKAYRQYHHEVSKLTEEIAHLVPGIEKRQFLKLDLDHKIPIKYGFKAGIHPLVMSCLSNLQVIPHKENFKKGIKLVHSPSILYNHDHIQSQLIDG